MSRILWVIAFLMASLSTSVAFADESFARQKNCFSCHSVNNRVVGPAFKDVAKKYAGDSAASDRLVQHVLKGSTGVWGVIPMPANTQVTADQAKQLVSWVLQLK